MNQAVKLKELGRVKSENTMAGKWEEFFRQRQDGLRQELILYYVPLVKQIVRRTVVKVPTHLDEEDLISFGLMGLINAVDKFNPDMGVKFETYASYRIRGTIIDEIRKANWLPRSIFKKLQLVTEAYRKLEQAEGEVGEEKWAREAGMTVQELHEVMVDISNLSCISLDEVMFKDGGGNLKPGDLIKATDAPDPQSILERRELKKMLKKALEKLNEKERLILALYYNERCTLKEIGKVLNISESRVCQLHGRAILRLKAYLEEWEYGSSISS